MNNEKIEKKTVKDKLRIVGYKIKSVAIFVGGKIKYVLVLTYLKLRDRMDQHSKISQYKKDIEKLKEEKFIVKNEHFQKINLLELSIEILQKERDKLRIKIETLDRALEIKTDKLIEARANLLILKKESEI